MDFISSLESFVRLINGFIWGVPMLLLLMGVGLVLTVLLKGIQFRKLPLAIRKLIQSIISPQEGKVGDITPFQALCTALSATMGTGNIAGVATAIIMGGPGALFWMWMTALVGMAIKFAEAVLALNFRMTGKDGKTHGGPMYYIEKGLGQKWLAVIFAICGTFAAFGIGSMTQANSVSIAFSSIIGIGSIKVPILGDVAIAGIIIGIILVFITALVTIGGIKRIGEVASVMVPFMTIFYFTGGLIVLLLNADKIPEAFLMVFKYAFSPYAVAGGAAGYAVSEAIRYGVARGVFSNEAGLGSAPIAYAAAKAPTPVDQGLLAMTEVFLDTIIVCTITGLIVITSGLWNTGRYASTDLTIAAFNDSLGIIGIGIVVISAILFGYMTILGWSYYGEQCFRYLLGENATKYFKVLFLGAVFLGAIVKVSLVWDLSDTFNGMMAIPNLIALLALSGIVVAETKKYFSKKRSG